MPNVISYNTETRHQFDVETQSVLDLITSRFPLVEIECVAPRKPSIHSELSYDQWFVQVYRNGRDGSPEGFFGNTPLQAAARVAKALKLELK